MQKKVALVYDRVNKWGGAERVLLALHKIFPKAPLYTSVYDKKKAPWAKVFPKIHTSFLQKIPFAKSNHEFLAPLMPLAFKSFNFARYDVVISVTSEFAKNIKTGPKTLHICYCLTPTRYLFSHYDLYFQNPVLRILSKPVVFYLRRLDKCASKKPDKMIAISGEVAARIKKYYGRDSEIIFPPVDTKIRARRQNPKEYYLIVGRLVRYKCIDLAVKSFNKLAYPLYIAGSGSEESKLKKIAADNIKFFGQVDDKKLAELYSGAKALIMPQEEDFGIVSVEAQSFGVPVITFKGGGALNTVIPGKTGIFFEKQNVGSLMRAVKKFARMSFSSKSLTDNAKRFSSNVFRKKILGQIAKNI
jgi:glycosyltransferase involved in cell wall biosynthesis